MTPPENLIRSDPARTMINSVTLTGAEKCCGAILLARRRVRRRKTRTSPKSTGCSGCFKIPTATSQIWTPMQPLRLTGASIYRSVARLKPSRSPGILYAPVTSSIALGGLPDSLSRWVHRVTSRFNEQAHVQNRPVAIHRRSHLHRSAEPTRTLISRFP